MSDQSQGHGYWKASDGKWYPPETHPNYVPSPPHDAVPQAVRRPTRACKACRGEIADGATRCQHCGERQQNGLQIVLLLLVIAVAVSSVLIFYNYKADEARKDGEKVVDDLCEQLGGPCP